MTPARITIGQLGITPKDKLDPIDQQKRFIVRVLSAPTPCPACGTRMSWWTAHRVEIDRSTYDDVLGPEHNIDRATTCVSCGSPIMHVLPFFGSWVWIVVPKGSRA